MSPANPLKVALIDDHALFAEALDIALSMEGYQVCRVLPGPALTPATRLLPAIVRQRPATVLLDLDLGGSGDGLPLVRPLALTGIDVVVITGTPDRARWGECVSYGARRVIPKTAPLNDILSTVGRLRNGLPVMSPEEKAELLSYWREQMAAGKDLRARLEQLTRREAEVLGQLMVGKQVTEIAHDRFVSESTVRTQVKSVLAKLQVGSQLTAVGVAHKSGWRPPHDSSTLVM